MRPSEWDISSKHECHFKYDFSSKCHLQDLRILFAAQRSPLFFSSFPSLPLGVIEASGSCQWQCVGDDEKGRVLRYLEEDAP